MSTFTDQLSKLPGNQARLSKPLQCPLCNYRATIHHGFMQCTSCNYTLELQTDADSLEVLPMQARMQFIFRTYKKCFYCGEPPIEFDYLIPAKSGNPRGPCTPACKDCEALLQSRWYRSLPKRFQTVRNILQTRLTKLQTNGFPAEMDLTQCSTKIQQQVFAWQNCFDWIENRLAWQASDASLKLWEQIIDDARTQLPLNTWLHNFISTHPLHD